MLRARITTHREVRECCVLIFTETWLSDRVTDFSYRLCTPRRPAASGEAKGGGVCVQQLVALRYTDCLQALFARCAVLSAEMPSYYLPRECIALFFGCCLHATLSQTHSSSQQTSRHHQSARNGSS